MKGKTYDVVKEVAQLYLPAAGTLYVGLAAIWGFPAAEEVSGTVIVVDTFLGAILKLSQIQYDARNVDGGVIDFGEDGTSPSFTMDTHPLNWSQGVDSVTFKVAPPS